MVSLRRRKLLGYCTGVDNSILSTLPTIDMDENATEDATVRRSNSANPVPLYDLNVPAEEEEDGLIEMDPTRMCGSNGTAHDQPNSFGSTLSTEVDYQTPIEVKPIKQHRGWKSNNQEHGSPKTPRGVYFKNKKWQAAIKVDKKQIHLGTFDSQKEAARLYDRAAYMCGRKPNFELSEEEKQELRKLEWDEFMEMTRNAISNKRTRRGRVIGKVQPSLHQNSDWEGDQQGADSSCVSDDVDLETSAS